MCRCCIRVSAKLQWAVCGREESVVCAVCGQDCNNVAHARVVEVGLPELALKNDPGPEQPQEGPRTMTILSPPTRGPLTPPEPGDTDYALGRPLPASERQARIERERDLQEAVRRKIAERDAFFASLGNLTGDPD